MSEPDVQHFSEDGTWVRPPGAVRTDVLVVAGGGGGSRDRPGANGEAQMRSFLAPDIPAEMEVTIGRGGRGGIGGGDGGDGFALVITHTSG